MTTGIVQRGIMADGRVAWRAGSLWYWLVVGDIIGPAVSMWKKETVVFSGDNVEGDPVGIVA